MPTAFTASAASTALTAPGWLKAATCAYHYFRAGEAIGHELDRRERKAFRWLLDAFESEPVKAQLSDASALDDECLDIMAEIREYIVPDASEDPKQAKPPKGTVSITLARLARLERQVKDIPGMKARDKKLEARNKQLESRVKKLESQAEAKPKKGRKRAEPAWALSLFDAVA